MKGYKMKKSTLLIALLFLSACHSYGYVTRSIQDDLNSAEASRKISRDVRLSFDNNERSTGRSLGRADAKKSYKYDRRSTDVDHEVNDACFFAFLDAAAALQQRARAVGGNAVTHICSYVNHDFSCDNELYYCQGGRIKSLVKLRGSVVRE